MPKKDNLLITNMNEFSKRLEGYCLNTTDIDGKYLCIGDKVKIYYNIFEENFPKDKKSAIYGIVKYNAYTNKYYINLLSSISINGDVLDKSIPLIDQNSSSIPIDHCINSSKYVERIESSQHNDFADCSDLWCTDKIDEFKKRILELNKMNEISLTPNDFINTAVLCEDDDNVYINYLDFNKEIFKNTNAIKKIFECINKTIQSDNSPDIKEWSGVINYDYLLHDNYSQLFYDTQFLRWICKEEENEKFIINLALGRGGLIK